MIWALSPRDYVKNAVKTVEKLFEEDGEGCVEEQGQEPFPSGYKPETDVTDELENYLASRYQQLIGISMGS